MLKLYLLPLTTENTADLTRLRAMAENRRRQNKIDRLRFPEKQLQSAAAGALIRFGLTAAGADCNQIDYTTLGQPFLPQGGVYFSLSHTDGLVLCAVSDHPVGADCEAMRPVNLRLARRKFALDELSALKSAAGEQNRLFLWLWTGKESLSKLTGEGLTADYSAFSLLRAGSLTERLDYCGRTLSFFRMEHEERLITVCTAGNPGECQPEVLKISDLTIA